MADRQSRLKWTWFAGLVGFVVGLLLALRPTHPPPARAEYYPLPHHVAKNPGGLSFRFVMAHDVLHERYPKHGPAHYRERNRLTREKLAALPPDDPATFPLSDDLAAGLARLGQLDEAVAVLRAKLVNQQAKGLTGRDLYTSYANLGAILFHARLSAAMSDAPAARQQAREGVEMIRMAVAVNPDAHFGREEWQVAFAEFILAAMDRPEVLRQYDFTGQYLNESINQRHAAATLDRESILTAYALFAKGRGTELRAPETIFDDAERSQVRNQIKAIGRTDFSGEVHPGQSRRVPFDEPALGIVGMWRQGIGPDPHFALCLGEIMLRVGQRFIAWAAFERASRMADRFWPDPVTKQFLRDHCKQRQAAIAATMTAEDAGELRPRFDAELAFGEKYQREYQEYEAAKIAAGVPLSDEHFYDDFHRGREPIASPSGPEEWYAAINRHDLQAAALNKSEAAPGWGLLAAGLAATAWVLRWRALRATIPS